jgi:DHA1 family bicyclomycin/chloramphenicol resistance-like MFS transporter
MMTQSDSTVPTRSVAEFVALMALMTSIVALSTDAMLPALPIIGSDLGVEFANDNQLVISAFFLGLAVGQIFFGPASDSIGRKSAISIGFAIFAAGCVLSIVATDFNTMLAGRVLQGIGAAGPRTVAVALVRDQYAGRAMARIMSFVMTVFILVPIVAPLLGQGILYVGNWQGIFFLFLALAVVAFLWLTIRQPETLPRDKRHRFSLGRIGGAVIEVCSTRMAIGAALAAGAIFSAMIGYLTSSQQIFQDAYGVGNLFPVFFAILAVAIGVASIVNARLVMRLGMQKLTVWSLSALTVMSAVFFVIAMSFGGVPPLWSFMLYGLPTFFCMGVLFGNLNAMAMEPLGHIAGVGSAVVASLTGFISLIIGSSIGRSYDGTVLPLVGGYGVLAAVALVLVIWVGRGRASQ